MQETLGARLRRRREAQHIALATIAEQTKIKLTLLEELERDDVSHWPAGLYRRSFVRAYAHAIGLDPDAVVREFLEVHPEPADVAAAEAIASALESARANGGAPNRLRSIMGSAFGSLMRPKRGRTDEVVTAAEAPAVGQEPKLSDPEFFIFAEQADDTAEAPCGLAAVTESQLPAAAQSFPEEPQVEPRSEAHVELRSEAHVEPRSEAHVEPAVAPGPPLFEPDLTAVAHLCTQFGRVESADQVRPLLQEAARLLDAVGIIVWVWDAGADELRPVLAHGYSDRILAHIPGVRRTEDNATAAAFRLAETCVMDGSDGASGALVLPLITPAGCSGVLAIELPHGREHTRSVRAVATIFAALLAQLVGSPGTAAVQPGSEETDSPAEEYHESPASYRHASLTH